MLERSQKPPAAAEASPESAGGGGGRSVDRLLFRNLVEMVPLVESLMDRRANPSYSRRASLVYTPAPAKKAGDLRSGRISQSVSAKKRRDPGDAAKRSTPNANGDDCSVASSGASAGDDKVKDKDELALLHQQVDDLQKKLLEKDELLKSAESSVSEMNAAYATIDELRRQLAEKESLMKSTNSQLHNAKIMLADKQASLEKLEWEVKMSNKKVEDLQGDVSSMDFEISALMTLFEKISGNVSADCCDDLATAYDSEALQLGSEIDNIEVEKIEEERATYTEALAAARENPNDEHLNLAAEARLRLQVLVL